MKNHLLVPAMVLAFQICQAQILPESPFVWMKGDNEINQAGLYGQQGVPHSINKPGARQYSATWRDLSGNLWLFGGIGYAASGEGFLNDLWKFDPVQNKWAWVNGDNAIDGTPHFGTRGVSDPANHPGGLYSATTWRDQDGNFWLFGGFGLGSDEAGLLNALWKYNPQTNQWTWVHGETQKDQLAVYGTRNIAHASNTPGARYGSQSWVDAEGNLWLFGGWGYNDEWPGSLNDLWKFDTQILQWTWVQGSRDYDALAVYGIKNIASPSNTPGGRYYSSSWTDEAGNFWLFGGEGYDETSNGGKLNDLWKYDLTNNQWTWISGPKVIDQPGEYGTRGQSSVSTIPGGRYSHNSWSDGYGNLWLFGGYGYDSDHRGYLNDLWKYNIADDRWTWVKGDSISNSTGVYGQQGQPSSTARSGARISDISWSDGTGNLWLFGGFGYDDFTTGSLNDLWKISGSGVPLPLKLLVFDGSLIHSQAKLRWESENEQDLREYVVEKSDDGFHFQPLATVPARNTATWQQYHFTDMNAFHAASSKIFYRLRVTETDGKSSLSSVLRFDNRKDGISLQLYPNPASEQLFLRFTSGSKGITAYQIFDMRGAKLISGQVAVGPGQQTCPLDIRSLAPGQYMLRLQGEESGVIKFTKL
jgi:N-acetylneuraminic acid mutarotase